MNIFPASFFSLRSDYEDRIKELKFQFFDLSQFFPFGASFQITVFHGSVVAALTVILTQINKLENSTAV
jgi:hypothetical protein